MNKDSTKGKSYSSNCKNKHLSRRLKKDTNLSLRPTCFKLSGCVEYWLGAPNPFHGYPLF
ncbi:MAG TPA: hypothetical protein VKX35_07390 [Fermentimonas sp.]|nr:hypothetical protein [Fermentimonas sp.]